MFTGRKDYATAMPEIAVFSIKNLTVNNSGNIQNFAQNLYDYCQIMEY